MLTLAANDIYIPSFHKMIPQVNNSSQAGSIPVRFQLTPDEIAQEGNKTFSLSFTAEPGAFGVNATLRNRLSGTIVDATGIMKANK